MRLVALLTKLNIENQIHYERQIELNYRINCSMAEEFPDYNSFFVYPKGHRFQRPENVNNKFVEVKETTNEQSVDQIKRASSYDPRQFETEKLTQNSLPNLQRTYGSIFVSKPYTSESAPLLNQGYHYSEFLCGEPVQRYRRSQIFLFFYIVFYIGYLIVGSICFQKLENGVELGIRQEFQDVRRKFLENNPSVKG